MSTDSTMKEGDKDAFLSTSRGSPERTDGPSTPTSQEEEEVQRAPATTQLDIYQNRNICNKNVTELRSEQAESLNFAVPNLQTFHGRLSPWPSGFKL